ncbi:Holliday junction resolvase RecU [Spiroplasma sp. AdecLV25b]|uniref:Holliday junction resolvase RecU n=1 Tax=Spiroplasma sp. AdecLV25b TaxID=3027162 RepID=UPI0027E213EA|nr:Holliday junction resolvase RecU [Spiroplasma sp. AdecLV25b]
MFYANRGMFLEAIINYTIEIINNEKRALIFKHNPLTMNNKHGKFMEKSNVDYHGIYKGKYLCFEAKSTKSLTLPWNNFKIHQLEYLENVFNLGGISFIIIYFWQYDEYFLVFWVKSRILCKFIFTEQYFSYQINLV